MTGSNARADYRAKRLPTLVTFVGVMMKSTFRTLAVAALLSTTMLVSACASDDPGEDPSATPTPTASATTAPTEPASPSSTPEPTPTQEPAPLTSLDQITVENVPLGVGPTVEAAWPLVTDTTMATTLIQGSGPAVNEALMFAFYYIGINARTGQIFDQNFVSTTGTPTPYLMSATGSLIEGFSESVKGVNAGSRVLIAITSADGYATGNASAGIEIGDTIVFIVDIVAAALTAPDGAPVASGDTYANVTFAADGTPIIQPVAGVAAPTTKVVTPLIVGASGFNVLETDVILVRYTGVVASTGRVLESNYSNAEPELAILSRLIPGFAQGLVDQPVGSRVLLTIPASEAYPNGSTEFDPPLPAGETLIYVVDILWTMPLQ